MRMSLFRIIENKNSQLLTGTSYPDDGLIGGRRFYRFYPFPLCPIFARISVLGRPQLLGDPKPCRGVVIRSSRTSALLRFLLFHIRSGNRVAESSSQGELREALCSHLDMHRVIGANMVCSCIRIRERSRCALYLDQRRELSIPSPCRLLPL
jgi:hypothetical protein